MPPTRKKQSEETDDLEEKAQENVNRIDEDAD
jgi:hypothetical protein